MYCALLSLYGCSGDSSSDPPADTVADCRSISDDYHHISASANPSPFTYIIAHTKLNTYPYTIARPYPHTNASPFTDPDPDSRS